MLQWFIYLLYQPNWTSESVDSRAPADSLMLRNFTLFCISWALLAPKPLQSCQITPMWDQLDWIYKFGLCAFPSVNPLFFFFFFFFAFKHLKCVCCGWVMCGAVLPTSSWFFQYSAIVEEKCDLIQEISYRVICSHSRPQAHAKRPTVTNRR